MQQLFLNQGKKTLLSVNKSEEELEQFICNNWQHLFPKYNFIKRQFHLDGNVHGLGKKGIIDILAYNSASNSKRFVVFELKKNYSDDIVSQAAKYSYSVKSKFTDIYVKAKEVHGATLPPKITEINKEVEIVLIAKTFSPEQIDQAQNTKEAFVTLIRYNWFENDLVLFDYVSNAADIKAKPDNTVNTKEPYKGKDWHYIVKTIQRVSVREALQAFSFPPVTKEQSEQLKALVDQVPDINKRTALQKRLEGLETEDKDDGQVKTDFHSPDNTRPTDT